MNALQGNDRSILVIEDDRTLARLIVDTLARVGFATACAHSWGEAREALRRHSPALALDAVTARLGRAARAEIHGRVLGSGLEMAAFCGWVVCDDTAVLGLPELSLGLLPGAGGTVSITRRIGRWRTAYLVLSGTDIDAPTALSWGLVDGLSEGRA